MRRFLSTIRWRNKGYRFFKRFLRKNTCRREMHPKKLSEIAADFLVNPIRIRQFNLPELQLDIPPIIDDTAPFYDIYRNNEKVSKGLIGMLLGDQEIKNILKSYFKGEYIRIWNASLNYSPARPTKKTVSESQLWHWDYSDEKMVHIMLYLKDVDGESGPFTYLSKEDGEKIYRHPLWIERYTDSEVEAFLGNQLAERKNQFLCSSGTCLIVDPGVFLHQGARNTKERVVLFISFTSDSPYEFEVNFLKQREKDKFWELLEKEINS